MEIRNQKTSIPYQVAGLVVFGVLTFFSYHFYKERMLHFDGAFYDFRLIRGGFNTLAGRYGDFINEILPWLAFKMHLPLATIIMLHSVNFMLFHYAIFLFITLVLKNNGAGLAALLTSCIAYAPAFYIPMEAVGESILLGCLLWAIVHPETPYSTEKEKRIAAFGAILTIVFMSFFHPLGIFVMLFVLGIEMTLNKRYGNKTLWFIIILGTAWYLLKSRVLFYSPYDNGCLPKAGVLMQQLPNWKDWKSTIAFETLLNNHFRIFKWLTIICLVFSIRKGIVFFLFCIVFILLFTVICLGTFYNGCGWAFETYFIIYGFFISIIFICAFYSPQRKNLILLIALPFLFIGLKTIYNSHIQYTYRLSYLSRIISDARRNNMQKCLLDYSCCPISYVETTWSIPYETLLYSSIHSPDSSVTIFVKDKSLDTICAANKDKKDIFFGGPFPIASFISDQMPQQYIRLPSTGYGYLTECGQDTCK